MTKTIPKKCIGGEKKKERETPSTNQSPAPAGLIRKGGTTERMRSGGSSTGVSAALKYVEFVPTLRKQFLILLCALLLFSQVFSRPAYADGSKDVEISYTVTEDMLPKASPSPTPSATPHPGKGQPPKTGDESNIMLYGLIASGSLLAGIGLFCYVKNKERTEYTDE